MRKEGVFSRKSNKSEKSRISQGQKKEPKNKRERGTGIPKIRT